MKDYIFILFISSLIISLIHYIGDNYGATKPYLYFVTGLISVLILTEPFLAVMQRLTGGIALPEIEDTAPQFDSGEKDLMTMAEKQLSIKINQMIREEFDVIASSVSVVLAYDKENNLFLIRSIDVIFSDSIDTGIVIEFLRHEFDAEITVRDKEG